jgi:hypothetical protein
MPRWPNSALSCLLHDGLGATNLPLDLFPGPASSFYGARLELPVRPRLLDQRRDPFLTENIGELAIGICVGEITVLRVSSQGRRKADRCTLPDDTHRGPHQRLASVGIVGDAVEELKDGRYIGLENAGCSTKMLAKRRRQPAVQ